MSAVPQWVAAGGVLQVPFMAAAGRAVRGEVVVCPKCAAPRLRHYFHVIDATSGRGTAWVWCDQCRTHAHLSRLLPAVQPMDPYADLMLEAFAELELDPDEPFLDRLNRLWNEAVLR